jgi:hypothetical protein
MNELILESIPDSVLTESVISFEQFFADKFTYNCYRLEFCTNIIKRLFFDNNVFIKPQRGDGNCLLRTLLDAQGEKDITIDKINELKDELLLSCRGIIPNEHNVITDESFYFDTNSPEYTIPLLHFSMLRNIKIVRIQLDPYNSFEDRRYSTFIFKPPVDDNVNVIFLLCFAGHVSLLVPQVPSNDICPIEWNKILYNLMIENNMI